MLADTVYMATDFGTEYAIAGVMGVNVREMLPRWGLVASGWQAGGHSVQVGVGGGNAALQPDRHVLHRAGVPRQAAWDT